MDLNRLKSFDAYAKTLDDFRLKTSSGGLITIISTIVIILLFFYELRYYLTTEVSQVLFVDTSRGEKMNITLDIVFPVLPCSYLTVDAMDVSGETQTDIVHNLFKTRLDLDGQPLNSQPMKASLEPLPKLKQPNTTIADDLSHDIQKRQVETLTTLPECETCYGAETPHQQCCPTCDDVKTAYRIKGWAFDPSTVAQCLREGRAVGMASLDSDNLTKMNEGCRVHGFLEVNKVAGNFHIAPGMSYQQHHVHVHSLKNIRLNMLNTSHNIHELSFGQKYHQQINPLSNTSQITSNSNDGGGVLFHYYVKIVPTSYVYLNNTQIMTNQYSVTKHRKNIQKLLDASDHMLPGFFVTYEISPMMVKLIEQRRSFAHFITSVCAIIGGVFTVASLLDAFVYRSSCLLLKKLELGKAS
ncbi:unnamed protein product [Didymodactylos carnosus]|uniref:Endoplasmic reticulum-Golgi intermediate compartment protein 3 n=1 Tax=Didymodactylos carnosus TaxID=1234261 RepID=A0A813WG28_9BILA|nr:unnamed protein product [Didymodactylos carnosus]CAF0873942.1 unnamed protein product [Didymodactylos carnosus]CAF3638415.1 unnamed protein product [Didymodactylos carnosus]CAF3658595.1 unnamed protein product [Didymodactylos carnosus]